MFMNNKKTFNEEKKSQDNKSKYQTLVIGLKRSARLVFCS